MITLQDWITIRSEMDKQITEKLMEMLPIYTQQNPMSKVEPEAPALPEERHKKKYRPEPEEELDDETFEPEEEEEPEEDPAEKRQKRYEQYEEPVTRISKQEMHKMIKEDAPIHSGQARPKNPDEDWQQMQRDYENR